MKPGMKKHSKKPKIIKKGIFIQDTGIYSNEILVCFGVGEKEVVKFMNNKKNKLIKNSQKLIAEIINKHQIFNILENNSGTTGWKNGIFILALKPLEDDWNYWETLIHEVHHIVEQISKEKMFITEIEAKAYLQGYIFNKVRRKIMGIDPTK
jgi:hypothetical protein